MATLTRTMTYAELVAAIADNGLNKGESITISDYQTVHTIPNTSDTNTGEIEPLLVTAISNNELKPEAYSVAFPDDVIYYSPTNDQTMVPGCTKGYIYRRIDTKQSNDFPFDFRQVKFRRWQVDVPAFDIETEYIKGYAVRRSTGSAGEQLEIYISNVDGNIGNAVTNTAYWRRFEWDNLTFVSPTPDNWYIVDNEFTIDIPCTSLYQDILFIENYTSAHSNKIRGTSENIISSINTIIVGNDFYYNNIGSGFKDNTIGRDFNYNNIGNNFIGNSIGYGFKLNIIGDSFLCNTIGTGFISNYIGSNFGSNSIGYGSQQNILGSNFSNNIIAGIFVYNQISTDFSGNTIGYNCNLNVIGSNCSFNSVLSNFKNNILGTNFNSNTILDNFQQNMCVSDFNRYNGSLTGIDFTAATHVYEPYSCILFARADTAPRLKYCNNSDVELIVAANA